MRPVVGKHDLRARHNTIMHPALQPFVFERAGIEVRNRCVLAAMTNKQSHESGEISEAEVKWLEARARGGFGMVFTAATHVEADGKGWNGAFATYSDAFLPGMTKTARSIKKHGALALAQLFHGGIRAPEEITGVQPKSASTHSVSPNVTARAMEVHEIHGTLHAFGQAARRCEEAGFDGIELHGAHGYLISQFLGPTSNQRTDAWGGSTEARHRFLSAIVKEVRQHTSPEFLVGVRLSPVQTSTGITLEDAKATAKACLGWELDFLHLSCWDINEEGTLDQRTQRYTEWFAEWVNGKLPLITTGAIWTAEDAEHGLRQGADFIGVARAGIGHHNWPSYLTEGALEPARPPFSTDHLENQALSPVFIDYMRRWQNFVLED